jgi:hypothetical protein
MKSATKFGMKFMNKSGTILEYGMKSMMCYMKTSNQIETKSSRRTGSQTTLRVWLRAWEPIKLQTWARVNRQVRDQIYGEKYENE